MSYINSRSDLLVYYNLSHSHFFWTILRRCNVPISEYTPPVPPRNVHPSQIGNIYSVPPRFVFQANNARPSSLCAWPEECIRISVPKQFSRKCKFIQRNRRR